MIVFQEVGVSISCDVYSSHEDKIKNQYKSILEFVISWNDSSCKTSYITEVKKNHFFGLEQHAVVYSTL